MLRTRVIPALLLRGASLVKTVRYGRFRYIGDPVNTVRIFNELEVDELLFLDISATPAARPPNVDLLADIANECFMPLGYGGGIRDFEQARAVFDIGFEKVAVNTAAFEKPELISRLAERYGSQAIIGVVDVKKDLLGRRHARSHSGRRNSRRDPVEWARELEALGAGEILLTAIDHEGTWDGFDVALTRRVADAVDIPVIAHGGAGTVEHLGEVVREGGASAVAVGSMVVFQKKGMGVLVNFPERDALERVLGTTQAGGLR